MDQPAGNHVQFVFSGQQSQRTNQLEDEALTAAILFDQEFKLPSRVILEEFSVEIFNLDSQLQIRDPLAIIFLFIIVKVLCKEFVLEPIRSVGQDRLKEMVLVLERVINVCFEIVGLESERLVAEIELQLLTRTDRSSGKVSLGGEIELEQSLFVNRLSVEKEIQLSFIDINATANNIADTPCFM